MSLNFRWLMYNKDEEEDVSSYWTALRKRKNTYTEKGSPRFQCGSHFGRGYGHVVRHTTE